MPATSRHFPLTPEGRANRIAEILATGLLRLKSPLSPPPSRPDFATEKPSDSSANQLDVVPDKSVTVTPG